MKSDCIFEETKSIISSIFLAQCVVFLQFIMFLDVPPLFTTFRNLWPLPRRPS